MLTRYTRDGIVRDLLDGKHVGLVGPRLDIAAAAFHETRAALKGRGLGALRHRNGSRPFAEFINGAQLTVHAARPGSLRGCSLDVVVILDHEHMNRVVIEDEARAALMPRKGELILALTDQPRTGRPLPNTTADRVSVDRLATGPHTGRTWPHTSEPPKGATPMPINPDDLRPRPAAPDPAEATTYRIVTTRPGLASTGPGTHIDTHHGIARIEWSDTFLSLIDGEGTVRTLYATGTVLQIDRLDDEVAEHEALMAATITAEQLRRVADRLDQDNAQRARVTWLPDIVKAIGEQGDQ